MVGIMNFLFPLSHSPSLQGPDPSYITVFNKHKYFLRATLSITLSVFNLLQNYIFNNVYSLIKYPYNLKRSAKLTTPTSMIFSNTSQFKMLFF